MTMSDLESSGAQVYRKIGSDVQHDFILIPGKGDGEFYHRTCFPIMLSISCLQ